jgi:hypothetical protein
VSDVPKEFSLRAIQDFARAVNKKLASLLLYDVDMGGRRITGAGKSRAAYDYVTRIELDNVAAAIPKADPTPLPAGALNPGSGGGGGAARNSAAITTASLADEDTESGSFTMTKSGIVYKIVTDQFARVRLYSTSAGRDSDFAADRLPEAQPPANINLLLDVVMNTAPLQTFYMQPAALVYNMDGTVVSTIYYNIQNLAGSTLTVTATFTYLGLES